MKKSKLRQMIREVIEENKNYWPFPEGKTEIWYMSPKHFRDGIMGYDWCKENDCLPDPKNLKKTHILLGTMQEDDLNKIFRTMQGERWSPQGEARDKIKKLGLKHTSMSVGDVIKVGNKAWTIDNFGFKKL